MMHADGKILFGSWRLREDNWLGASDFSFSKNSTTSVRDLIPVAITEAARTKQAPSCQASTSQTCSMQMIFSQLKKENLYRVCLIIFESTAIQKV
jgi:hypothetical protein